MLVVGEAKCNSLKDGTAQLYMALDCCDRFFQVRKIATGDLYAVATTLSKWCFERYSPRNRTAGYPAALESFTVDITRAQFSSVSAELRNLWRYLSNMFKYDFLVMDKCVTQDDNSRRLLQERIIRMKRKADQLEDSERIQ